MKSDAHRHQRVNYIDRVTKQITSLIADHTPADAPLVRIVGALVPIDPIESDGERKTQRRR